MRYGTPCMNELDSFMQTQIYRNSANSSQAGRYGSQDREIFGVEINFVTFFLTVEVPNLQKLNVLGEENVNFSELYVRHFPREFVNSMVNRAQGQNSQHGHLKRRHSRAKWAPKDLQECS